MNNNDKCSDDRFEYLLSRAIAKTISSEKEDELWDNYFGTTDVEKSFKYFRTAVERSYVKAYYWLGRAFLLGEGCERSNADALHYLNLSIDLKIILIDIWRTALPRPTAVECAGQETSVQNLHVGGALIAFSKY